MPLCWRTDRREVFYAGHYSVDSLLSWPSHAANRPNHAAPSTSPGEKDKQTSWLLSNFIHTSSESYDRLAPLLGPDELLKDNHFSMNVFPPRPIALRVAKAVLSHTFHKWESEEQQSSSFSILIQTWQSTDIFNLNKSKRSKAELFVYDVDVARQRTRGEIKSCNVLGSGVGKGVWTHERGDDWSIIRNHQTSAKAVADCLRALLLSWHPLWHSWQEFPAHKYDKRIIIMCPSRERGIRAYNRYLLVLIWSRSRFASD